MSDITRLRFLLVKNGWEDTYSSGFFQTLYEWFPLLFPPPDGSPFDLHQFLVKKLGPLTSHIIFIDEKPLEGETKPYFVDKRLKAFLSSEAEAEDVTLFRVKLPRGLHYHFSCVIETSNRLLTLQQIHYRANKHHIATIRKVRKQWICIDDNRVSICKKIPIQSAVWLFYRVTPLSLAKF